MEAEKGSHPRVLTSQIDDLMGKVEYKYSVMGTSTFCYAFLDGEFYLASGHSACVSPENFNSEVGRELALTAATKAARDKLWELEGYALWKSLPTARN